MIICFKYVIRYPRGGEGKNVFKENTKIEYGKSEILQEGNDISILAIGKMVDRAIDVCNKLKEDNVDAIYISDYDEIVDYLRKHVKENDIILTLGAGNVTKIAKKLIEDK